MNTKTIITTIAIGVLIIGSVYFYFTNDAFRGKVNETLAIEATQPPPVVSSYNAVFVVFDPSGSGIYSYSVPRITTSFINSLIDRMLQGYGELWLTYIVKDAFKNKVLHFSIPKPPQAPARPVRFAGEAKYKFNMRMEQFNLDSLNYAKELFVYHESLNKMKQGFFAECQTMIDAGYARKKPGEDYSDVIGSLNAAIRSLATVHVDSIHFRSILLISDGEQDLPPGSEPKTLNPIPDDVRITMVNHSGSKNSAVAGRAAEVDNLDRALEMVIQAYKR